ncbi:MAG: hypothetical protein A2W28_07610 [Gammaproteobacteria bacterium RBG_16_51_14]|nr:MAG: hypothetical protein A2W28_07610 [Gammaproteobacteria bacterium RBG_16_51_14]
MGDFIQGLKYLFSGFTLITRPGIRLYVIVPFLINSILFAGGIIYGAHLLGDFIDWLIAQWSWLEWLEWLVWPLFLILSLTVVFFCFSIIANLLAAPFNGFLAQAVEHRLTGVTCRIDDNSLLTLPGIIVTAIKSETRKFLYFLVRAIPLLLLFAIPLVNVAAPVLWLLFGAWMLALEYIDYPLGNHDLAFPEQRKILSHRRKMAFGFGAGVMMVTLCPVINFIAMPVAVAGAARMVTEKFLD